jgi:tetratricopeptide (TPR) repeat protein
VSDGLWSVQEAAELFGLAEARLRYWAQTGFVGPSVRQKGRFYYSFQDLISLKTAVALVDRGVSMQRVRKNLDALRRRLPEIDRPLAQLRICSDGDELVVVGEDAAFEPASGQLVMSFAVKQLHDRLAEIAPLPSAPVPRSAPPANDPVAETAYGCFQAGLEALDAGDDLRAEKLFRRALALDAALAAAWTNIGNLLERRGEPGAARGAYEQALAVDPEQPEARYDLANLLADAGELELAIAEYRRAGGLADAHYNLGLVLLAAGRVEEARAELLRYLELDGDSEWAARARGLLGS